MRGEGRWRDKEVSVGLRGNPDEAAEPPFNESREGSYSAPLEGCRFILFFARRTAEPAARAKYLLFWLYPS